MKTFKQHIKEKWLGSIDGDYYHTHASGQHDIFVNPTATEVTELFKSLLDFSGGSVLRGLVNDNGKGDVFVWDGGAMFHDHVRTYFDWKGKKEFNLKRKGTMVPIIIPLRTKALYLAYDWQHSFFPPLKSNSEYEQKKNTFKKNLHGNLRLKRLAPNMASDPFDIPEKA